jgi:hypothetical protein
MAAPSDTEAGWRDARIARLRQSPNSIGVRADISPTGKI